MRNKILLVESEPDRRDSFAQMLTDANYFVISTPSAEKALDRVWRASPDLITVSLRLDGMTTLQFCSFLRNDERLRRIPIVLMSDPLPSKDVAAYIRAGVDDHVTYSMDREELLARIRALLRRVYAAEVATDVFEHGGLCLRVEERQLLVDGDPVKLTRKEFELLQTLMSRPDKVIPTATLLSKVWGYDKDVSTKTLQVHITRLRSKLGKMAGRIRNFPGVGYTFSTHDDRGSDA